MLVSLDYTSNDSKDKDKNCQNGVFHQEGKVLEITTYLRTEQLDDDEDDIRKGVESICPLYDKRTMTWQLEKASHE